MNLSSLRSFASQSPHRMVHGDPVRASVSSDGEHLPLQLDDVPDVLNSVAEFATRHASTQAVVAYADSVVLEAVCKVVLTFGHGTNENAHALFWPYVLNVVLDPNNVGVVAECDLTAIWRKMIRYGILDDLE